MGPSIRYVNYLSLYRRTHSSHFGRLIDLLFKLTLYSFPVFSIYGLTKSRIQSLVPMAFSIIAFVFGMVTIVSTSWVMRCGFLMLNSRDIIDII